MNREKNNFSLFSLFFSIFLNMDKRIYQQQLVLQFKNLAGRLWNLEMNLLELK